MSDTLDDRGTGYRPSELKSEYGIDYIVADLRFEACVREAWQNECHLLDNAMFEFDGIKVLKLRRSGFAVFQVAPVQRR
jgi:hypothetical protein